MMMMSQIVRHYYRHPYVAETQRDALFQLPRKEREGEREREREGERERERERERGREREGERGRERGREREREREGEREREREREGEREREREREGERERGREREGEREREREREQYHLQLSYWFLHPKSCYGACRFSLASAANNKIHPKLDDILRVQQFLRKSMSTDVFGVSP